MTRSFEYRRPASVAELIEHRAAAGPTGRILAGGTDLIVQMRSGALTPQCVIDAKGVPELNSLLWRDGGLTIGAAVTCRTLNIDREVGAVWPALLDATGCIGGVQIQGRASVGGNLCNASPSADTVPALIALGVQANIEGSDGARSVAVEAFCTGPGRTVLADDELLVSLSLPAPKPRSGACFSRFTPRKEMDIAVASAAASIVLSEDGGHFRSARIALGAVAPTAVRASAAADSLCNARVSPDSIAEAARLAAAAASPIDDMRGSAEQREHLVTVLVRRCLLGAIERARRGIQ